MDILYCINYLSRYYIKMCYIKKIKNCKKMIGVSVNGNYFNDFIFVKFIKYKKIKNSYIEE